MSEEYYKSLKDALGVQLALSEIIRNDQKRVLIICEKCMKPFSPHDIEIRKASGLARFYFGKRCKGCVEKANAEMSRKMKIKHLEKKED